MTNVEPLAMKVEFFAPKWSANIIFSQAKQNFCKWLKYFCFCEIMVTHQQWNQLCSEPWLLHHKLKM